MTKCSLHKFKTRESAENAIRGIQRESPGQRHSFRCTRCGAWHIGLGPGKERQRA